MNKRSSKLDKVARSAFYYSITGKGWLGQEKIMGWQHGCYVGKIINVT